MGATTAEKLSLRRQLNADVTALPDAEIDALWAEAEVLYPTYVANRAVIFAAVRLQAWRELMVQASKRVDYKQNQSEEKLSQLLANMQRVEDFFKKQLDDLITSLTVAPVRWGGMRNIPTRRRERPDG